MGNIIYLNKIHHRREKPYLILDSSGIEPPVSYPELRSALKEDLRDYYSQCQRPIFERAFNLAWDKEADNSWQSICDSIHLELTGHKTIVFSRS